MRRNRITRALVAVVLTAGLLSAPMTAGAVGFTPGYYGDSLNLVTNATAETGDLTGWTPSHFTVDGSSPLIGSYSFAANLGDWAAESWISQEIDVSNYGPAIDAGGIYVYVDYVLGVGSPGAGTCLTWYDLDSNVGLVADHQSPGNSNLLSAGTDTLTLYLGATNDNAGSPVAGCTPKIDNARVLLFSLPTCDIYTATHIGTSGPDVITGTADADVIVSMGGDDEVHAMGGDDIICLGGGADLAYGGPGGDTIFGGRGRDVIYGNGQLDWIYGGRGNDRIYGNRGIDHLYGDLGHDRIRGGGGGDVLFGGEGNDKLIGNRGNDFLLGGADDDLARGGAGYDGCDAEIEYSCEAEPA
jgi:Ca2+-binding RTX toxin-like protein